MQMPCWNKNAGKIGLTKFAMIGKTAAVADLSAIA
jgi:hypothetical protein